MKPALTVDAVPATTLEEEVIVTGTVANDAVAVHVGTMDNAATVANGKFTATVKLTVGDNNILVHAVDLAGNASEQTVKVTKTVGTAASIDAADITVGAGESVDVAAAVKDAKGNTIADAEITGEATGETPIGTYADGKFTAGEKAGEGTLTLKSGELTKEVKVTVTAGAMAKVAGEKASVAPGDTLKLVAQDKFGNTVEGATFSEDSANAVVDGSTFIATESGTYTVKATKGDVTVEGKIGVYGDAVKLVASGPETVIGNDSSEVEVTVAAVDEAGNIVGDFDGYMEVVNSDLDQSDTLKVETVDGVAKFHFTALPEWAGSVAELNFQAEDDTSLEGGTEIEVVAQKATTIELSAPEYLPTNGGEDYTDTVEVNVLDQAGEEMASGSWDFEIKVTGPALLDNGDDTSEETLGNGDTFDIMPESAGDTGNVEVTVTSSGLTSAKATIKAAFAKDAAALSLKASHSSRVVADTDAADSDGNGTIDRRVFTFTAKVTDKAGVPVTNADNVMNVKFEGVADKGRVYFSNDLSAAGFKALNDETVDLTVSANPDDDGLVKFYVIGEVADTFKVSLTDPTGRLTASEAVEATLNADNPNVVGFEGASLILKKARVATGELAAQLYDQFGNKAAVAGAKITFGTLDESYTGVKLNGSSKAAEDVRTDATGQAKVKVDLTAASTETADIVVSGNWNDDALLTEGELDAGWAEDTGVTVYDEVAVSMASELPESISASFASLDNTKRITSYALSDTLVPGEVDGFNMKVVVKDDLGAGIEELVNEDFKVTASESGAATDVEVRESTYTGVEEDDVPGTYYAEGITPESTGTLSVEVKLVNYGANNTISKSIAVRAGAFDDFELAEASTFGGYDGKILVAYNTSTPFTVQLLDKWGNAVTDSDEPITVEFGNITDGIEGVRNRVPFLDIRDASGAPISELTIKSGRVNGKFYVLTNAKDATFEITVGDVTYQYIVNPTGETIEE